MKISAFARRICLTQSLNLRPLSRQENRWRAWSMSPRTLTFTSCLAVGWLASHSQPALAQVVQLPSQHIFSSTGSVLVPDGGSALVAGSGYARQGSVSSGLGPLSNRAVVGSAVGSTLSASVQIIDVEALDQAILAIATPRTTTAGAPSQPTSVADGVNEDDLVEPLPRARLRNRNSDRARKLSANNSERVGADPSEWQRVLSGPGIPVTVNEAMVESNVRYYVELGEQAERSGSVQAARVYYRLARQAMTPELLAQYENSLRARAADAAAAGAAEQEQASRKF